MYEIALIFVSNINMDDKTCNHYLGKTLIVPLTELFRERGNVRA